MQYDTVFFDLDGTLIESGPAIFAATRATLEGMGLSCPPDDALRRIIGPPLRVVFTELLNTPESRADEAVELYRKNAQTMGIALGAPYQGVLAMLAALREGGVRIGVVTSKIQSTALEQLEAFGIAPYVSYVRGAFASGSAQKTELLRIALKEFCTGENRPVMVGDRYFDLDAARDVNVASIGVLYGYGDRAEIEACAPTHIAESVQALQDLLLS